MAKERYTAEEVVEALLDARGIKLRAAEKLGCERHLLDRYEKKYTTVAAAVKEGRQMLVDTAEGGLLDGIQKGDATLIIFALKTVGRERGYSEQPGYDIAGQARQYLDLYEMAVSDAKEMSE